MEPFQCSPALTECYSSVKTDLAFVVYFLLSGHLSALHKPQHWLTTLAIPAESLEQACTRAFLGIPFIITEIRQQLGYCSLDTWSQSLPCVSHPFNCSRHELVVHEGLTLGFRIYRTKIKPSKTYWLETNLAEQPKRQKNDETAQVLGFRIELFKILEFF